MKQPPAKPQASPLPEHLLGDIRQLIEQSRQHLASAVNSALTLLYWHIGQRVRSEVLQEARAGYGEQIVATLSKQLEKDYGRGFSEKNLRHMLRFAEVFPEAQIVSAARRQFSLRQRGALQAKLHEAIALSRARLENRGGEAA